MNNSIPKQFIKLKGIPVLMHTIKKCNTFYPKSKIIVALNKNYFTYWRNECEKLNFKIKYKLIKGGETRFHSVKKSLKFIDKNSIIAIHDGVRPLFTNNLLKKLFKKAQNNKCVVPYIKINDTVKIKKENINKEQLILLQTPQLFKSEIITEAYNQEYNSKFTDDSSVVEAQGYKITYLKGEKYNIKITTKEDLKIVEKLI